jgi:hypothetical protein
MGVPRFSYPDKSRTPTALVVLTQVGGGVSLT